MQEKTEREERANDRLYKKNQICFIKALAVTWWISISN